MRYPFHCASLLRIVSRTPMLQEHHDEWRSTVRMSNSGTARSRSEVSAPRFRARSQGEK